MSTTLYEPFYVIDRPFDDVLLPRVNAQGGDVQLQWTSSDRGTFKPRMDLHEDAEKNLVTAVFEFPGLNKGDVSIDVHNSRLTVSAESKAPTEHKEEGYAIRERSYGRYLRTVQLPQGIESKDVTASMDGGLLTVIFPKATPNQAPKRITIWTPSLGHPHPPATKYLANLLSVPDKFWSRSSSTFLRRSKKGSLAHLPSFAKSE